MSPTITSVANKACVSISTVSRALRNDPKISPKTALRIKKIADEIGYRPNPYVSVLMSHLRTSKPVPFRSTIAFLDLFNEPEAWKTWPVHRQWFEGAHRRAEELGYSLERFWAFEPGMNKARLTKILQARGITGVIVPPDDSHVIYLTPRIPLEISRFSTITIGAQYHEPDLHFCSNDQFASMRKACLQLLSLGYRKIGLVTPRYIESIVDYRFGGAYVAAQLLESNLKKVLPVCYAETRQGFEAWFSKSKPDCIIALSPRAEVYNWITSMKILVPEELGFAILDWDDSHAEFSGINQNHEMVGAATVDCLVNQITRNERNTPGSAKGMLIEGFWVPGKTTIDPS